MIELDPPIKAKLLSWREIQKKKHPSSIPMEPLPQCGKKVTIFRVHGEVLIDPAELCFEIEGCEYYYALTMFTMESQKEIERLIGLRSIGFFGEEWILKTKNFFIAGCQFVPKSQAEKLACNILRSLGWEIET